MTPFAERIRNSIVCFALVYVLPAPQYTLSAPLRKIKKVPGTIPTPPFAPGSSIAPAANAEEKAFGKVVLDGYARTLAFIKATGRAINQSSFVI